jgi:hypothetical protein
MNYYKADIKTNDWLKTNGISVKHFAKTDSQLLKAQKTAFNLLKHHLNLLSTPQIKTLQVYCAQMANDKKRNKITDNFVYKVLNIGTKINRQLFKANKEINNS